ncbi:MULTISPECIES: hypothetical protein [Streptomyces]|uniref:hypothetical protein n=1 Tax=Streptomyces TaxID=1883 RepID=UPI000A35EF3C|nr:MULTISPECIES: hypothetical protein [Streptomyces]WDI21779.1 hypothetical protein PS783_31125 [Streptomyces enissocaesilis]MBQ0880714.1 hypothetical protein [Streptomyces sp. RT42]MDI3101412.1 hypothetical protein [Streptomyces sp. AN-3]QCR50449.1 hypothetical protein C1N79_29770 [Streptomyces sp. SGAir0924]WMI56446.1 hypothetical protein RBH85_06355 [Streptomyces rochei]
MNLATDRHRTGPAAPDTAEAAPTRAEPDLVEFLLSPLPGGALPASRLAGPEDVLLPFAPGTGRGRGRRSGG